MADKAQLEILIEGPKPWNAWRLKHPDIKIDLSGAKLNGAKLYGAYLGGADLSGADLNGAVLYGADLCGASLRDGRLNNANLTDTDLSAANLSGAALCGAIFLRANLSSARLNGANLRGAYLERAILVNTDLSNANLEECRVYGVSAWGLTLDGANQKNLRVTPDYQPEFTVDDLEVAQLIYLILNNQKLRNVISTLGKKAVLILGRFSPERKEILDALAERLRVRGLLPIIFDFEKSKSRDFIETIKILAGLSLFVIADITKPKSSPLELQATIPDYMVPFVPLLQEGEDSFIMFRDLQSKYDWVLPVVIYKDKDRLLAGLFGAIIKPALLKNEQLIARRAQALKMVNIEDVIRQEGEES